MLELFKKFIYINWLRPENAMFNALRASSLLPYKFKSPSIDISCGDGIFSFIVAGGELDQRFDKFLAVDTSGFRKKADIHDFVPEAGSCTGGQIAIFV